MACAITRGSRSTHWDAAPAAAALQPPAAARAAALPGRGLLSEDDISLAALGGLDATGSVNTRPRHRRNLSAVPEEVAPAAAALPPCNWRHLPLQPSPPSAGKSQQFYTAASEAPLPLPSCRNENRRALCGSAAAPQPRPPQSPTATRPFVPAPGRRQSVRGGAVPYHWHARKHQRQLA